MEKLSSAELEEKNLSDNRETFTPSFKETDSKQEEVEETSGKIRRFELEDLNISQKKSSFNFDSETARNFDTENIDKAHIGVKEVVRDALEKATAQARLLKDQAIKEGTAKGYHEGFEKGREEAKIEFSPVLETLQKSIEELSGFRKMMYTKMEREMMEMTLALVKKIIHFELSARPDSVQEMIRLAVNNVLDKESMTIKINPEDKTHAESFRPELQQMYDEIKNITFEVHSGIQRGGCVIESNFGTIDARIEKLDEQIDHILNLAPPGNEPQDTNE